MAGNSRGSAAGRPAGGAGSRQSRGGSSGGGNSGRSQGGSTAGRSGSDRGGSDRGGSDRGESDRGGSSRNGSDRGSQGRDSSRGSSAGRGSGGSRAGGGRPGRPEGTGRPAGAGRGWGAAHLAATRKAGLPLGPAGEPGRSRRAAAAHVARRTVRAPRAAHPETATAIRAQAAPVRATPGQDVRDRRPRPPGATGQAARPAQVAPEARVHGVPAMARTPPMTAARADQAARREATVRGPDPVPRLTLVTVRRRGAPTVPVRRARMTPGPLAIAGPTGDRETARTLAATRPVVAGPATARPALLPAVRLARAATLAGPAPAGPGTLTAARPPVLRAAVVRAATASIAALRDRTAGAAPGARLARPETGPRRHETGMTARPAARGGLATATARPASCFRRLSLRRRPGHSRRLPWPR